MTFYRRKTSKYCPWKKLKCTFLSDQEDHGFNTFWHFMYGLSLSMPLVFRMTSFAFVKTVWTWKKCRCHTSTSENWWTHSLWCLITPTIKDPWHSTALEIFHNEKNNFQNLSQRVKVVFLLCVFTDGCDGDLSSDHRHKPFCSRFS